MAKPKQDETHEYAEDQRPCLVIKAKCGHYVAAYSLDAEDLLGVGAFMRQFDGYHAEFEVRPVSFVRNGGLTLGCQCKR